MQYLIKCLTDFGEIWYDDAYYPSRLMMTPSVCGLDNAVKICEYELDKLDRLSIHGSPAV